MALSTRPFDRFLTPLLKGTKYTGTRGGSYLVGMYPLGNPIEVYSGGIYRLGSSVALWSPPGGYSMVANGACMGYYKEDLYTIVDNASSTTRVYRIDKSFTGTLVGSFSDYSYNTSAFPPSDFCPYLVCRRVYLTTIAKLYTVNLETGATALLRDVVASDSQNFSNTLNGRVGYDGYYYFETMTGATVNYKKTTLPSYSATVIRTGDSNHKQGADGLYVEKGSTSIWNDARSVSWTFSSAVYDFVQLSTDGSERVILTRRADGVYLNLLNAGGSVLEDTRIVSDTCTNTLDNNCFRQGALKSPGSAQNVDTPTFPGLFWGNAGTSAQASYWSVPILNKEVS